MTLASRFLETNVSRLKNARDLVLAGSLLGAMASLAASVTAGADEGKNEKCFGVAVNGMNICAAGAGTPCAGASTVDYQGNAWISCRRINAR
jgi:uncharacterized membrane protein